MSEYIISTGWVSKVYAPQPWMRFAVSEDSAKLRAEKLAAAIQWLGPRWCLYPQAKREQKREAEQLAQKVAPLKRSAK